MRAAMIVPGEPGLCRVEERPDPVPAAGELLVEGLYAGVCATDVEVVRDGYGLLPPGESAMVGFHESLGRVLSAPDGGGFTVGDLVVGVVRRPDPVPCGACAVDQWDFCLNGEYTERGIKGAHGYGATRWCVPERFAVRVDPVPAGIGVLAEPASVVAKAWEQVDLIGRRAYFNPRTALVTGAGPIGLLAALIGRQRGLDTHVVDLVTEGPKPDLVRDLGAVYHHRPVDELGIEPDVVIECTGVPEVVVSVLGRRTARNAITVLAGITNATKGVTVPAALNNEIVLENDVIVGCVNASRRNYDQGAAALAAADPSWLARLITRQVPLTDFPDALRKTPDDIKVTIDLTR